VWHAVPWGKFSPLVGGSQIGGLVEESAEKKSLLVQLLGIIGQFGQISMLGG